MPVSTGPPSASLPSRKRAFGPSRGRSIENRRPHAGTRTRKRIMTVQPRTLEIQTELAGIPGTAIEMSRVAVGTWAIGGGGWGGAHEAETVFTIRAPLDPRLHLIHTAPAHWLRRSPGNGGQKNTPSPPP